jgi:hypothetical protein
MHRVRHGGEVSVSMPSPGAILQKLSPDKAFLEGYFIAYLMLIN